MTLTKIFCGLVSAAIASGCGGGGGGAGGNNTVNQNNNPPKAVIESSAVDYTAGSVIELSSASSTDDDGDTLSVNWRLEAPEKSYASLRNLAFGAVEFEPDMAGTFTVHLEVTDGRGGLGRTSLNITPSLPTPDSLPTFVNTTPPRVANR